MKQIHPQFLVIGNPENRRIGYFQAALHNHGLPSARVIPYIDLLTGMAEISSKYEPYMVVRIESPGENFDVEKSLLSVGYERALAESSPAIEPDAIRRLNFDRGLILYPRQYYLGYQSLLAKLAARLVDNPGILLLNQPNDIAVMFDKGVCHERCKRVGLPVPLCIGPVHSYDELLFRIRETGLQRVFVKLANSSSASGVVAFSNIRGRPMAITSSEVVELGGHIRLYNSLKIRCYREPSKIVRLIDALCRERVHVEEWLPKASLGQGGFDLRIVTINGEPHHTVVRQGRSPMTNLHLGNRRGEIDVLHKRMGPECWDGIKATCRRAAALFPHTLHTGIDICITPGWRRHAVLEINAFGDLLPNVYCNGHDTYSAEVGAVLDRFNCCGKGEKFL